MAKKKKDKKTNNVINSNIINLNVHLGCQKFEVYIALTTKSDCVPMEMCLC